MVKVVTQTANHQSKALNLSEHLPPLRRRQNGEHHLGDVECMTPVVVSNVSIILLHAQQPPAKHFVVDVESLDQIQIEEHSQAGLEGAVIVQIQIVEGEVVQLEVGRRWDFQILKRLSSICHQHGGPHNTITLKRTASSVEADA